MTENELSILVEKYPLSEGVKDMEMSAKELSQFFGKSTTTIAEWHQTGGMPVLEHGGHGKPYKFLLSHVYAWFMDREQKNAVSIVQQQEDIKQARLALFPDGEEVDETMGMSSKERVEFYKAQNLYMQTNEFRENYCPKQDVVDVIEEILVLVRDTMTGLPSLLENDANATPQQVELAIKVSDQMITTMQQKVQSSVIGDDDNASKSKVLHS
ncbi:MAG: terminase small subunit [Lentilitoribacter sp.]